MAPPSATGFRDVIVVGAGPAGMLLALFLAKSNIPVTIIEMSHELDKGARATHYAAPAMYELNRAGVGAEMRRRGFLSEGVCWRKLDGTMIVDLDARVMDDDPDRLACLPLAELQRILRESLQEYSCAKILFEYKVVTVGQNDHRAWADVKTPEGDMRLEAGYIVGCDGANSQVRKSLFGDWEFPGKTWDEQIVATNLEFSKTGLWRVTYGEKPAFTKEELRERLLGKFKAMLPGHPEPSNYKIDNFAPYKVHQRLAKSMRVGRFLLAADAAHLCNPFGGLGLTGSIVDVGNLYDCLRGKYENRVDDSILDKYNKVRRKIYLDIIDVVSSSNLRRLFELDPNRALKDDTFFQLVKKAESDPVFSKDLQNEARAIQHDFMQYYRKDVESANSDFIYAAAKVVLPNAD